MTQWAVAAGQSRYVTSPLTRSLVRIRTTINPSSAAVAVKKHCIGSRFHVPDFGLIALIQQTLLDKRARERDLETYIKHMSRVSVSYSQETVV